MSVRCASRAQSGRMNGLTMSMTTAIRVGLPDEGVCEGRSAPAADALTGTPSRAETARSFSRSDVDPSP